MTTQRSRVRRGFSLLEAVVVVLVLSISIPTTIVWTDAAVSRRADAVAAIRATAYASAVMETILADVSSASAGLGYASLSTPTAYIDGPSGLRARTAAFGTLYEDQGMRYAVAIGNPVSASGLATGSPSVDLFRGIDVTVSFPLADGGAASLTLSGMVTQW